MNVALMNTPQCMVWEENPIALAELRWSADPEWGVREVTVEVYVTGDEIVDIMLNEKSMGFFGVRAVCKAFNLLQAETVFIGDSDDDEYIDIVMDMPCYTIPLQGEYECDLAAS